MHEITTREEFDAAIGDLRGAVIEKVRYCEIEYDTDGPCYLHRSDIGHFLDYGVEWQLTDGTHRSFIWDNTFYPYGVGLYLTPMDNLVTDYRKWDVTNTKDWEPLVNQPIAAATAFWSWVNEPAGNSKTYYPQDLKFQFSAGQSLYVGAAQFFEPANQLMGLSDEIMLVFSDEVAKRYKVGPFAEDA